MSPVAAWRRRHEVEGQRATVIDLYELTARAHGLAAHQLPLAERASLARSKVHLLVRAIATVPSRSLCSG